MRKPVLLFVLLALFPLMVPAGMQLVSSDSAPGEDFRIRVESNLVLRTVSVRDDEGKPVEGLTESDFVITEDGVPQTVSVCELQRLVNTPLPPMQSGIMGRSAAEGISMGGERRSSSVGAGKVQYQDRRLMVLYFDLMTMSAADRYRAFGAGQKFIREQMVSSDMIAIMIFSKSVVRVLVDFTDSREKLDHAIRILMNAEDREADPGAGESGSAFGQNSGAFNLFSTDRQLAALQTAARMLGSLGERKLLVYFAAGLRLEGLDNQAQLRATINTAVRSGVSLYPIDARGLMAAAPMGDASVASPGGLGMYTGAAVLSRRVEFQESQDTLFALAANTGGKAMLDYNDLNRGIVAAQQSESSYYILGYYPTNSAADGKFRRIRIELAGRRKGRLDYLPGYYAEKSFAKFTEADKERQLEEALMLEDPITELPIALEVNYFKLNRAEYYVPVTVKIPGSELMNAKSTGSDRALIDFIGEIRDDYGIVYTNMRDEASFRLKSKTAEELSRSQIEYDCGFTLLPGRYIIKMLARNAETGRIGTYLAAFTIPNLMKESDCLPISSVVLGSQWIDMQQALYTAGKDRKQTENPLVFDGRKLIPSVNRVFDKNRSLYVYLEIYDNKVTEIGLPVAFISFYRDGAKAFETPLRAVREGRNAESKVVAIRLHVPLNALPPGEYICQVTVLDPASGKAAFRQAPILLIEPSLPARPSRPAD